MYFFIRCFVVVCCLVRVAHFFSHDRGRAMEKKQTRSTQKVHRRLFGHAHHPTLLYRCKNAHNWTVFERVFFITALRRAIFFRLRFSNNNRREKKRNILFIIRGFFFHIYFFLLLHLCGFFFSHLPLYRVSQFVLCGIDFHQSRAPNEKKICTACLFVIRWSRKCMLVVFCINFGPLTMSNARECWIRFRAKRVVMRYIARLCDHFNCITFGRWKEGIDDYWQ